MKFKNLNHAFVESMMNVDKHGHLVSSRGTNQKELLFYNLAISDPTDLHIEVPIRKFKPDYAIAEWAWYCSRDPNVRNIGQLASIWNKIADDKNEVESNYGTYLLGEQWTWVKNELIRDNDTRRATLVINQPYHKGKNNADYPCTQYLHFFIRNGSLHLGVHMRSNDAVFGFCNDVFTFSMFQQLMLNDLNATLRSRQMNSSSRKLKLGEYHHTAGSFHVYEDHFRMMQLIKENYYARANGVYPDCKRYKLKEHIVSEWILENALHREELTTEQLNIFTKQLKEEIYE